MQAKEGPSSLTLLGWCCTEDDEDAEGVARQAVIKWIHPNLFKASPPDPTRAFLQPLSLSSTPCSLLFSRHGGSSFKDAHDRGGGSHWKQQLMIMMMMPPASLQGRMQGGVPLPAQPPPPPPPAGTPPSPCLERRSQIQSLASSSSNSREGRLWLSSLGR